MDVFASARERRLWAWTAAVVIAIYSTLGLAARLAGVVQDSGVAEAAFSVGVVLVVGTVAAHGLRARPRGGDLAVLLGVVAAFLLLFARMSAVAERTHLVEYAVVAVLIHAALTERGRGGRPVRRPGLLAVTAASLVGVVDEAIQGVLPERVFDPRDMVFNALAAALAVMAGAALRRARRRAG